ncbi:MAG TPA: carboxypeptidase-like regulatory domain-containing protein [Candidatus Thermoplasmatota archaeon]|nr:carboxypeptidase-like regulatory domain-containing protein [Candidatus Thermoplasmatota archaeon]
MSDAPRRFASTAFLLLLVFVAPGCVTRDIAPSAAPSPTDATTLLQGVVVDESMLPIAGADVRLLTAGRAQTPVAAALTLADGSFEFLVDAPGSFWLAAAAPGFENASLRVDVVPPGPIEARLTLRAAPLDVPYVALDVRVGHISCAASVVLESTTCDNLLNKTAHVTVLGEKHVFHLMVPKGHVVSVGETDSESRSFAMSSLYTINRTAGLREAHGKPLIRAELHAGQEYFTPSPIFTAARVPPSDAWFGLGVLVNYAGLLQPEIDGAAGSVCRLQGFACAGVGATTDHRFTHFLTMFVGKAPADVAGYSAVPK